MKGNLILVCAGMFSGSLFADSTVTVTAVRQNWPWSPTVDISYTLEGDSCDVDFEASFDGQEAFPLAEKDLSGDFFGVKAGVRHVTWDPVSAGYGGRTLPNFTVTAKPSTVDRTYLIIDWQNGTLEYAATEPEGGWISLGSAYHRYKMVFRRIPAGTSTVGFTDDILAKFSDESSFLDASRKKLVGAHQVTLTDDFYLSVYTTTSANQYYMVGNGNAGSRDYVTAAYRDLRGTVDGDGIDWPSAPTDIYEVAPTSTIGIIRGKLAGKLPKDWTIDLPTLAQFEYASKATTPDGQIWSVGGTVANTKEELCAFAAQVAVGSFPGHAVVGGTAYVGQLKANGWGLYDTCGLVAQWTLNYYSGSVAAPATDPLGGTSGNRTRIGYGSTGTELSRYLPTLRGQNGDNSKNSYRLCIHTRRIRP